MEYKLYTDPLYNITIVIRKSDGASIPIDESNKDYQEYLEWTKASPMNVAEPADEVTE
jgi:hypothetical protein